MHNPQTTNHSEKFTNQPIVVPALDFRSCALAVPRSVGIGPTLKELVVCVCSMLEKQRLNGSCCGSPVCAGGPPPSSLPISSVPVITHFFKGHHQSFKESPKHIHSNFLASK